MSVHIPDCPLSLKSIQHYLKTATEHDNRDVIVAYWCRLHALQVGLKITNKKTPEETKVLMAIMDWLEEAKKTHKDNESIINEVVAQAHLENYALKLFQYADKQDREMNYGKNIVKAFYTAGMIYDVLTTFGELTDEALQNRKYAKWKAAYIHNCLKNGETPVPGPLQAEDDMNNEPTNSDLPTPAPVDTAGFNDPGFKDPTSNAFIPSGNLHPTLPTSLGGTILDPNAALQAASKLPPVPYTPDPNPGGFVPYEPSGQPQASEYYGDNSSMVNVQLSAEQISKAQKYCKWASSALNYDDVKTAVNNLQSALQLLQTGRDPA